MPCGDSSQENAWQCSRGVRWPLEGNAKAASHNAGRDREGGDRASTRQPSQRAWPCQQLTSDVWPQRCERTDWCCLQLPSTMIPRTALLEEPAETDLEWRAAVWGGCGGRLSSAVSTVSHDSGYRDKESPARPRVCHTARPLHVPIVLSVEGSPRLASPECVNHRL